MNYYNSVFQNILINISKNNNNNKIYTHKNSNE